MKEQQMILRGTRARDFSRIYSSVSSGCIVSLLGWMDNYTYHEGTESEQQRLVDGAYDSSQRHGQPSLTVRMTISEGRVVDKEVIKHFAS